MTPKKISKAVEALNKPDGRLGIDIFIIAFNAFISTLVPEILDSAYDSVDSTADKFVKNGFNIESITTEAFPDIVEVTIKSGFAQGVILKFPASSFEGEVDT